MCRESGGLAVLVNDRDRPEQARGAALAWDCAPRSGVERRESARVAADAMVMVVGEAVVESPWY